MRIVKNFPPNIEKIKTIFKVDKDCVFCYGETIFNPYDIKLSDHVIVHEGVHSEQQKAIGGAEVWWNKYIDEPEFRIKQEAEAYGAQLKFIKVHYGPEKALEALHSFANYISSDVYGSVVNYTDGREMIRRGAYDINKKAYI